MTRTMTALCALALAAPAAAQEMTDEQRSTVTELEGPKPEKIEAPADGVPSDATVLFGGDDLGAWESVEGGEAQWHVEDGIMRVNRGTGAIRTTGDFCDVQLHVEWRAPEETEGYDGQDRGNSGIFLQERYEVQVLDSYDNPTYANGQAASIYKQHIPLVNASRAPGEWQSYDIIYTAPEFGSDDRVSEPARVTVMHNGVVVQNDVEIQGKTVWIGAPFYDEAHGCAPIMLQDHDADVAYRNIWVRDLS
ncbi:3-keto-disaccharide hydrolase [Tranquillimonas rosea]|uniref:3-keto-disaccharide hydrolase n=1 Tax=Tranquillimonas rosea TaxID=641238 RepID=UPI003BAD1965